MYNMHHNLLPAILGFCQTADFLFDDVLDKTNLIGLLEKEN